MNFCLKTKIFGIYLILLILLSLKCNTMHYTQGINVASPTNNTTLKITENTINDKINLRSQFSINMINTLKGNNGNHSKVNKKNVFETELFNDINESYYIENKDVNIYNYRGDNIIWTIPEYNILLDVDFKVLKHTSLAFGLSYSRINNKKFIGKNFGIGVFNSGEKWGVRTDFNLLYKRTKFNVKYVEIGDLYNKDYNRVYFYENSKFRYNFDYSLALTINTLKSFLKFNYFINCEIGSNHLYDYRQELLYSNDEYFVIKKVLYSILTIGFYKNVDNNNRIILGLRMIHTELNSKFSNEVNHQLFFQLDNNLLSKLFVD